jgi:transmembrane sensor
MSRLPSFKPLGSRAASVFEAMLGGRRHLVHPDDLKEADAFWEWLGDLERPVETPERPRRSWLRFAPMAAALVLTISALSYWQFQSRNPGDFVETYQSVRAERRVIELADGSVINLAPESQIDVRYGPAERRIRLLRGQGLFDVASNPERPFIVEVAHGEVRAVGTSFDVIAGKDEASVTVVEGIVRILLAGKDKMVAGGTKEARQGEMVRFGTNRSGGNQVSFIAQSNGADVSNATAWTRGVLIFRGEPLARVIETVNLYSQDTVHLEDPSLANLPVFGVIRQGDASALKELIADPDLIEIADE